MRRFGRPVGGADSLSFVYYNEARARREDRDNEEGKASSETFHLKLFI